MPQFLDLEDLQEVKKKKFLDLEDLPQDEIAPESNVNPDLVNFTNETNRVIPQIARNPQTYGADALPFRDKARYVADQWLQSEPKTPVIENGVPIGRLPTQQPQEKQFLDLEDLPEDIPVPVQSFAGEDVAKRFQPSPTWAEEMRQPYSQSISPTQTIPIQTVPIQPTQAKQVAGGVLDLSAFSPVSGKVLSGEMPNPVQNVMESLSPVKQKIEDAKAIIWAIGQDLKNTPPSEVYDRLANARTRALSSLAFLIPGVTRENLLKDLEKEAEQFTGLGSTIAPAVGDVGALAADWIAAGKAFKVVGKGFELLSQTEKAKALGQMISKAGGVKAFQEKFPRLYSYGKGMLESGSKGYVAFAGLETPAAIEEGGKTTDIIKKINMAGLKGTAIAGAFHTAGAIDTNLWVRNFRNTLVSNNAQKYGAEADRIINQLSKVSSATPEGATQQKFLSDKLFALRAKQRLELQTIDNITSSAEAELIGLKNKSLFKLGQEGVESPQEAAKRIIQKGYEANVVYPKGVEELKIGLGKQKPTEVLPTTLTGRAVEAAKDIAQSIKQPMKAIKEDMRLSQTPEVQAQVAKNIAESKAGKQPIVQKAPEIPQFNIGEEIVYEHKGKSTSGRLINVTQVPATETRTAGILYEMQPDEGGKPKTFWGDEKNIRKPVVSAPVPPKPPVVAQVQQMPVIPPQSAITTPAAPQPPTKPAEQQVISEKQPWEMTADEWRKSPDGQISQFADKKNELQSPIFSTRDETRNWAKRHGMENEGNFTRFKDEEGEKWSWLYLNRNVHKMAVAEAIKQGKPVPPEVLKDYPDLQPTEAKPTETLPAGQKAKTSPSGAIEQNKPILTQSNIDKSRIRLEFDNTGKILTEAELEKILSSDEIRVSVTKLQPNIISAANHVTAYEIRVMTPTGTHSKDLAKQVYDEKIGTPDFFRTQSAAQRALSPEERYRRAHDYWGEKEFGQKPETKSTETIQKSIPSMAEEQAARDNIAPQNTAEAGKGKVEVQAPAKQYYNGVVKKEAAVAPAKEVVEKPQTIQISVEETTQAAKPQLTEGYVEVKGGNVRPFKQFRQITKGRKKGQYEITMPTGEKITVEAKKIRSFPKEKDGIKGVSGSIGHPSLGAIANEIDIGRIKVSKEPRRKPQSAREIIDYISRAFNIPVRGKATFRKRALGWFDPKAIGVRLQDVRSLSTAMHEIGHHIDWTLNKRWSLNPPSPAISKELTELGKLLYGETKPKGGYKSEGWAEYTREYLTSDEPGKTTPNLHKFFTEEYLPQHPDIARNLAKIKQMIDTWRNQGAEARIASQINKKKIRGTFGEQFENLVLWIDVNMRDELAAIRHVMKKAGIKPGELRPSEDPYQIAVARADKSNAIAEGFVLNYTTDLAGNRNGKGLREILAPVSKDINTFIEWAFAAEAKLRWSQGKNPGISKADADYVYKKYDSPEWQTVLKEITGWNHKVLDYVVEAGGLDKDVAKIIKAANPIYLPLMRAFKEGELNFPQGGGKGLTAKGTAVKRMKGSGREIIEPLEAMIAQTKKLILGAHKAEIGTAFAKLADRPGMASMIWKVPAPMQATKFQAEQLKKDVIKLAVEKLGLDPSDVPFQGEKWDEILTVYSNARQYYGKDNIISVVVNGERNFYELHPALFRAMEGLDQYTLPWFWDLVFGKANRALRLGATGLNASFGLVRNLIRDAATFTVTSKHAKWGPVSAVKGVISDIANVPAAQKFKAVGGKMSSQILADRRGAQHLRKRALAATIGDKTIYTVSHPVDALRELFGVNEAGTRIGEFEPALKYAEEKWGKGSKDAMIYALNAAQDVTTNFTRHGRISKVLNQMIPFYNAAIQGPDKIVRTFKERPAETSLKAIMGLTISAIVLWWLSKDEDWYKNLSDYEKVNYAHFRVPGTEKIVRFPVPFQLGYIFMSAPVAALNAQYTKNPQEILDMFKESVKQSNPLDWPASFGPIVDVLRNKDYQGKPIIPRSSENKLPEDRYNHYTTELMKLLGGTIGVSPAQLEYLVDGYSGGLYTRTASSLRLPFKEILSASDIPVLGTLFLRDSYAPKKQIETFYDQLNELNQKYGSLKITPEEMAVRKVYNKISDVLSVRWKELEATQKEAERKIIYNDIDLLLKNATEINNELRGNK